MTISQILKAICLIFLCAVFSVGCDDKEPIIIETGTVTDVEGNVYTTAKIGDQWWMTQDLKVTSFRSGTAIPKIENNQNLDWANATSPAYSEYSDLAPGFLYNYYTINIDSEEIAPEGWHIPTDEEWKTLEVFLGMPASELDETNWRGTDEGDKMKLGGGEGWTLFDGVSASNESGFSAFGGSARFFEGQLGIPGLKQSAFYWSSTENGNQKAYYRYLDYKKSGIFRYFGQYNYGFAIRCVKDN